MQPSDTQARKALEKSHKHLPLKPRGESGPAKSYHVPVLASAEPPRVSVILPTYNRPEMLIEAVQSVLRQTLADFEILVINDAGQDVLTLLKNLDHSGKIRYLAHEKNHGLAAARNTGLRAARGRYIAYLDDDDIFYAQHLETLVRLAESGRHPVVYSDAHCAQQKKVGGKYVITRRRPAYSNDFDADRILVRNLLPVLCVLHERPCTENTGPFDESLTTHEDWDMWIRMSRYYPFFHLKEVTCEFRSRKDGSSMSSSKHADFLRTAKIIFSKHETYASGKPEVVKAQREDLLARSRGLEKAEKRNRRRRRLQAILNWRPLRILHSSRG